MKAVALLCILGAAALRVEQQSDHGDIVRMMKKMQKNLDGENDEATKLYKEQNCADTKLRDDLRDNNTKNKKCVETESDNIAENEGKSAKFTQQIKNLTEQIQQESDDLDADRKMEKKRLATYNEEDKDNLQTVTALKDAVAVLKKHHSLVAVGGKVSSTEQATYQKAESSAQHLVQKLAPVYITMTGKEPIALVDSVKQPKYASQSGEIFGVLEQMLEQFTNTRKEEGQKNDDAIASFGEREDTTNTQLDLLRKSKGEKESSLADAETALAAAREKHDACEENLTKDTALLTQTLKKIESADKSEEKRVDRYNEETSALGKGLEIMESDDTKALFGNVSDQQGKESLLQILHKAQQPSKSNYDKMMDSIADLISNKKQQKQEDVDTRDSCIAFLNKNALETKDSEHERDSAQAKADQASNNLDNENKSKDDNEEEKDNLEKKLKQEGELRAKENAAFQKRVKNYNNAIGVLGDVKQQLGSAYDSKKGGGGGILALLSNIVDNYKDEVKTEQRTEQNDQDQYTEFAGDSNDSIDGKEDAIGVNNENINTYTNNKEEQSTVAKNADDSAKTLNESRDAKNSECKDLLDNFSKWQANYDADIVALQHAQTFLSGPLFKKIA